MRYPAFLVVEKSQIAGLHLLQEPYRFPLPGLLMRIPQQRNPEELVDALREPAAVGPENTPPTPEIRRVQEFVRQLPDRFRIGHSGGRIPDLPFVPDLILPPFCPPILHRR